MFLACKGIDGVSKVFDFSLPHKVIKVLFFMVSLWMMVSTKKSTFYKAGFGDNTKLHFQKLLS